jgi:endonuclease/exonuclease/phosphatase family metal-dependent hydrolase
MTRQLRIGTWNCFGMGQGIDAVLHRSAPMGHRFDCSEVQLACCTFDVFCVQEILSRKAQRFFDELDPSHYVARIRDDNRPRLDLSVRGTGLGISASVTFRSTVIRTFAGERVGWDRLARKGAIYTAIEIDGVHAMDVVNVHLQAGYDHAAIRVRLKQLEHLRALVADVGTSQRPFVVCGDFNICGLASSRDGREYRGLLGALDGFVDLGADDDLPTLHPHPEGNALAYAFEPRSPTQRVDYVFLRSAGKARCTDVKRFFDRPTKSGWPSDHYGLAATIEID